MEFGYVNVSSPDLKTSTIASRIVVPFGWVTFNIYWLQLKSQINGARVGVVDGGVVDGSVVVGGVVDGSVVVGGVVDGSVVVGGVVDGSVVVGGVVDGSVVVGGVVDGSVVVGGVVDVEFVVGWSLQLHVCIDKLMVISIVFATIEPIKMLLLIVDISTVSLIKFP